MPSPFRSRPPEARAEAYRDRLRPRAEDSGVPLYAFAFGALLLFLVAAMSFWQLTAPAPATRVIEAGIVSLTDIDLVLAEHQSDLQALAIANTAPSFTIPGYPLDVHLSRAEVLNPPPGGLRALILERSSALVYTKGLSAFDRTGGQSLSLLSKEGMLQFLVGQLSASSHRHAGIIALVLAGLTAVAGIALVLKADGMRRVRALGEAALPAGLLGLLGTFSARAVIRSFGGDDRFAKQIRETISTVADVPLRNFTILAIAGAILLVAGLLLGLLQRLLPAPRAWGYEPDFEDDDFAEE